MTHILVVFQEDVEVEVFPEDGVGGDAAQEDLVHGHGLLEDGQVLTSTEMQEGEGMGLSCGETAGLVVWLVDGGGGETHASSSCFILVNSSLVMEPSPSPNFWSFSLEASKSGLGGAGGIYTGTAGRAT